MQNMRSVLRVFGSFMVGLALSSIASAQTIDLATGGADPIWRGTAANARAGASLDQGAVNAGDSRRDLIMGTPGGPGVVGAVYIVFGGPIRTGELLVTSADASITGAAAGDLFGATTAAGNILNTEGSTPRALVVAAPNAQTGRGRVYLFAGGFTQGNTLTTANAVATIVGAPGDRLGTALATADLNFDGYREIVIGAPGNNRLYVIAGGPTLGGTIDLSTTAAAITITASDSAAPWRQGTSPGTASTT